MPLAAPWLATAAVVVSCVLFPVYTTVVAALKPGDRVLVDPLVPDSFTLDVLREAWTEGHLGRYLFNSVVVGDRGHRRSGGHVGDVGVRVRDARVPGPQRGVRRLPRHDAGAARGDARRQPPHRSTRSAGSTRTRALTVPFLATAFGTFLVRQVLADAAARPARRGAPSTAWATSASCATSPCR